MSGDGLGQGRARAEKLAGRDLNNDGVVTNLIICGDSRFYDYGWLEAELETWIEYNCWPDVIICGGASGIDALAERWATNHNIHFAAFEEAWEAPRPGVEDPGRSAASPELVNTLLGYATHVLACPGPRSVWTHRMVEAARAKGLHVMVRPVPEDDQ